MKSLQDYLSETCKQGIIDHAVRCELNDHGQPRFYIHPAGVSGDTVDFVAVGNVLFSPADYEAMKAAPLVQPRDPQTVLTPENYNRGLGLDMMEMDALFSQIIWLAGASLDAMKEWFSNERLACIDLFDFDPYETGQLPSCCQKLRDQKRSGFLVQARIAHVKEVSEDGKQCKVTYTQDHSKWFYVEDLKEIRDEVYDWRQELIAECYLKQWGKHLNA